jgi:hypothetical protein
VDAHDQQHQPKERLRTPLRDDRREHEGGERTEKAREEREPHIGGGFLDESLGLERLEIGVDDAAAKTGRPGDVPERKAEDAELLPRAIWATKLVMRETTAPSERNAAPRPKLAPRAGAPPDAASAEPFGSFD